MFSGLNCINNLTFGLFEVKKRHLFAEIWATLHSVPRTLRQKKMLSPEIMARMQRLADSAAVLKPIAARIQIHF